MIIKVCGNRDASNIAQVSSLTPMLMGFIFYPSSPRDASGLTPDVISHLPQYIRPVAVFVDTHTSGIIDICRLYGFRIVQLHGDETPEQCRQLKDHGLTVFKTFAVGDTPDWESIRSYEGVVDMFLFDTKSSLKGGSGLKFDWHLLDNYPLDVPYMLSGGIGPDDVDSIIDAMQPGMAGIDINSRFETAPGIKDIALLTRFILSLRKFNEDEQITAPFWEKAE